VQCFCSYLCRGVLVDFLLLFFLFFSLLSFFSLLRSLLLLLLRSLSGLLAIRLDLRLTLVVGNEQANLAQSLQLTLN